MAGKVSENGLRQRKPAETANFTPSDEGRKTDERLDKHERYVFQNLSLNIAGTQEKQVPIDVYQKLVMNLAVHGG